MPSGAGYVDAQNVPRIFSDDVLRGLRWGAILLAGLAIGVACYRLVREPAPKPAHETHSPAHVVPATEPEKRGSPLPAKSIDKPVNKSALLTSGSRPVPPPPARAAKPIPANPVRGASGDTAPAGEAASKNEDESAGADENPAEPFVAVSDEKKAGRTAAGRADAEESPGPAAVDENAAKQEARGKRWIKAVGRLFGIGRKDSPH